jgi:glyoxylase-like metal-dependent hydrolase (beta-lactamase superfamily II)
MVEECKIAEFPVYQFVMPVIASNMYIVIADEKALIVDPHVNEEAVDLLQDNGVQDIVIVLTHEHFDHISGVNFFREKYSCTVYGNEKCRDYAMIPEKNMSAYFSAMFIERTEEERKKLQDIIQTDYGCRVDECFTDSMDIVWEGLNIHLLETPGHSQGSICAVVNGAHIFTGDSLVQGAKIITRLPGGSKKMYQEKTKPFLESLHENMVVFPGHGMISSVGELRDEF